MRGLAAACLLFTAMSSCDSAIYDDEGDCATRHYVRFVYDYNMLNADAFAGNVKSVALFAFDPESHVLLKKWTTSTPDMARPGWKLEVDVTPGATYDLLAWCGIDADPAGFTIPDATIGVTTRDQLQCALLHEQGTLDNPYPLAPMWYGRLDEVTFTDAEAATQVETIRLTKDTNNIFVALQNLSGEAIPEGLFEFTITDNTGLLSADNIPFDSNPAVTYHPYHTALGYAVYDPSVYYDGGTGSQYKPLADEDKGNLCVAVAELSVNRIMADSEALLAVRRADTGEDVFKLPLKDLALAIKGYQNRHMDDQEFLDRQDSYNMTFFLDKSQSWAGAVIMINSWRVVYQPTIFG